MEDRFYRNKINLVLLQPLAMKMMQQFFHTYQSVCIFVYTKQIFEQLLLEVSINRRGICLIAIVHFVLSKSEPLVHS